MGEEYCISAGRPIIERDDKILKSYLLGELDEEASLAVEHRIMIDDDQFEMVQIAEDELIDEYLEGTLSQAERERFESHFLSTEDRRRKLEFAETLYRNIDRSSPSAGSESSLRKGLFGLRGLLTGDLGIPVYAAALSCLVVAIGGFGAAYLILGERTQTNPSRAPNAELVRQVAELRKEKELLEIELQSSMARNRIVQPFGDSGPTVASFVLAPGTVTRGASPDKYKKIEINSGISVVRLRLDLEEDRYPDYRATLLTAGGTVVRQFYGLLPKSQAGISSLSLSMPAGILRNGVYTIRLEGVTADQRFAIADRFYFTVLFR